jgi:hypothetical protein
MKSMFGSSRSIAQLDRGDEHRAVASGAAVPGVVREEEEREVDELGRVVAPITLGAPVAAAASGGGKSQEEPAAPAPSDSAPASSPTTVPGPSADTSPADWSYGAEGGAHVVFTYHGASSAYTGKLLRIRKISTLRDHPPSAASALWRDMLLPRFAPAELLIRSDTVKLGGAWLRELLLEAEIKRPAGRVEQGEQRTLGEEVEEGAHVWVMENMRTVPGLGEGERVLAVEIKVCCELVDDCQWMQLTRTA